VNAYVRDGFLPETVLDRAGCRETDDRLPTIVAAIKGADPDITLQAICTRLEAMRERTPRGRASWQRPGTGAGRAVGVVALTIRTGEVPQHRTPSGPYNI
jgi:hypothetical protein